MSAERLPGGYSESVLSCRLDRPALSASRDGCTNRRQELVLRRGLLAVPPEGNLTQDL